MESTDHPSKDIPQVPTCKTSYNTLVDHLIEAHGLIFDTEGFAFDFLGWDELDHIHELIHAEPTHTHDTDA